MVVAMVAACFYRLSWNSRIIRSCQFTLHSFCISWIPTSPRIFVGGPRIQVSSLWLLSDQNDRGVELKPSEIGRLTDKAMGDGLVRPIGNPFGYLLPERLLTTTIKSLARLSSL